VLATACQQWHFAGKRMSIVLYVVRRWRADVHHWLLLAIVGQLLTRQRWEVFVEPAKYIVEST
jgi:hypothetical protein